QHAGTITGNSISGAVVNLVVEGIGAGAVTGNTVSTNQGSWGFPGLKANNTNCTISASYTAHFYGTANIDSGWVPNWFFASKCGSWNTSLPRPDDPGAIAHSRYLLPNQGKDSNDGNYHLEYQQSDGNLVLYQGTSQPWSYAGFAEP